MTVEELLRLTIYGNRKPPKRKDDKTKQDRKMTYGEIYNEALWRLCLDHEEVEDYRPASKLFIPELERDIPNAIIIWLKDGSKVIYIERSEVGDDKNI